MSYWCGIITVPQKHGYGREGAYPVSDTYPTRIRPGYGRDTYPRRVRVSLLIWAGNSRMDTSRPSSDTAQPNLPPSHSLLTCSRPPPTRRVRTQPPPARGVQVPDSPTRRRSAARRQPASALAGDEEPPRRRRRAAPGLQQRAPASRDGDEELRPRPFEIQQRRALAGCPPEEWNCGRRACLMSWRATTALRPPRRPDG